MSQFFNLDSSEHSKGYDHTASSIPVPLIYLDQMPMSTMLSETSSDKTYFDSSQSFDNTTDRATQKITSEKNTLPAMPVGDEISYNKPQQFTVSADPPTRPISTYLPRTPSKKTNTSSQFTSLTDSPFLTTHLPMNNNGFPNVGTKKTTAKQITSPCPPISLWLPIPHSNMKNAYINLFKYHDISKEDAIQEHPLKLKTQQKKQCE